MENGDDIKPLLTTIDVQRGFKEIIVYLKSGEARPLTVTRISWPDLAEIHLQEDGKAEMHVLHASVPAEPWSDAAGAERQPYQWLEWLDMESHNEVCRIVREFAYGFRTEKKRTLELRQFGRTLSEVIRKQRSSVSGSDLPTPSPGADRSSSSSPTESEASKLTTA